MRVLGIARWFFCLLFVFCEYLAMAQGVIVYKKDGSKEKFPYETIDSIVTYNPDEEFEEETIDFGYLSVSIRPQIGFKSQATRAVMESYYDKVDNYIIQVLKEDGTAILECQGSELSKINPLAVYPGNVLVKAFCGTELPASRDSIFVYGESRCSVSDRMSTHVIVTCTPTSGSLSVEYDKEMDKYFKDYHMLISGIEALGTDSILWLKNDMEPWFIKLNESGENVSVTIKAALKETYLMGGAEPEHNFTFNIRMKPNNSFVVRVQPYYTNKVSLGVTIEETGADAL